MSLSIIIPTLNEAGEWPKTIRRAKVVEGLHEIIVVEDEFPQSVLRG